MSFNTSKLWKSKIGAHQYTIFVFIVNYIVQIVYLIVTIKILVSYEVSNVNFWPQMKAKMLALAWSLLVFYPPKIAMISKSL